MASHISGTDHREDVAGRANVEDTPELLAYYDELDRLAPARCGRWPTRSNRGSRSRQSVPVLWRYGDLRDMCCGRSIW
jgi:gentisate 1,2-dioxygenase